MHETLLSILMAVSPQGTGIPRVPQPPPPAQVTVRTENRAQEILRLTLDEIRKDQERAWEGRDVGGYWLEFMAGFDPEVELWVKVRARSGRVMAFSFEELQGGVNVTLDYIPFRVILEGGTLRVFRRDMQHQHVLVSLPVLIRALYDRAIHVLFPITEYAVLREEFPLPDAIVLLRRDYSGRLWATYYVDEQMGTIRWFLAENGVLYGMQLEGDDLVFYNKPVPETSFAREILLPEIIQNAVSLGN